MKGFDIHKPLFINLKYDKITKCKYVVDTLTHYGGVQNSYFEIELIYRKNFFKGIQTNINLVNDAQSRKNNSVKRNRAIKIIMKEIINKKIKEQFKLDI